MALNLRVRTKNGQFIVKNLQSDSLLEDLKIQIGQVSGFQHNRLEIKQGYPPKSIDMTDNNATLNSLNIRSGETLLVEEISAEKFESQKSAVPYLSTHNDSIPDNTIIDDNVKMQTPNDNSIYNNLLHNGEGILMREVVPANNSCLFLSVDYVMKGGKLDLNCVDRLRRIVSNEVKQDPLMYNEALLGRPNPQYSNWILDEKSWGGAIELAVLCKHFQVEIVVINTITGTMNRFGEDKNYKYRVLLVYDGIHYDPIKLCLLDSTESVETIFSTADDSILIQALDLANEAKSSHQYTDTSNFSLRCLDCRVNLVGEAGAQKHAEETGHIHFGELS